MFRLILKSLLVWLMGILSFVNAASGVAPGRLSGGQLGDYRYFYYLPAGHDPQQALPLVVVLHGCKQTASEIAKGTQFNMLADAERFIVLYPETEPALNNPYGCWLWWGSQNQKRDSGEPKLIVQMIELLKRKVRIDSNRVYVTGLSSGAGMSAILASIYPDVFAAMGIHSGLAYGAASSAACGMGVMRNGLSDPEGRGELAYHHQGGYHRVVPAIVFQGTGDTVVDRINADHLVVQLAQMNDLADDGDGRNDSFDNAVDDSESGRTDSGYEYSVYNYRDNRERVVVQKVLVESLQHAWSGGSAEGSYTDPAGPDATTMMWAFFRQWSLDESPLIERPAASCTEHRAANYLHFWWHRTMSWKEYLCDPWRVAWRHSFDGVWASGRCP